MFLLKNLFFIIFPTVFLNFSLNIGAASELSTKASLLIENFLTRELQEFEEYHPLEILTQAKHVIKECDSKALSEWFDKEKNKEITATASPVQFFLQNTSPHPAVDTYIFYAQMMRLQKYYSEKLNPNEDHRPLNCELQLRTINSIILLLNNEYQQSFEIAFNFFKLLDPKNQTHDEWINKFETLFKMHTPDSLIFNFSPLHQKFFEKKKSIDSIYSPYSRLKIKLNNIFLYLINKINKYFQKLIYTFSSPVKKCNSQASEDLKAFTPNIEQLDEKSFEEIDCEIHALISDPFKLIKRIEELDYELGQITPPRNFIELSKHNHQRAKLFFLLKLLRPSPDRKIFLDIARWISNPSEVEKKTICSACANKERTIYKWNSCETCYEKFYQIYDEAVSPELIKLILPYTST